MNDQEMHELLARIDERTLNIQKTLSDHLEAQKESCTAHNRRLDSLERWKERAVGVVIGISIVTGFVASFAYTSVHTFLFRG